MRELVWGWWEEEEEEEEVVVVVGVVGEVRCGVDAVEEEEEDEDEDEEEEEELVAGALIPVPSSSP